MDETKPPHRDPKVRMSEADEEVALTLISSGCRLCVVAEQLNFRSRRTLFSYRINFPEFDSNVQKAKAQYCEELEEDLLTMADEYPRNPRLAEVKGKHIMNVLKYRNPKVYGDRVDLNVSQTIDIGGSLERAERRVVELGVTNVIPILNPKKDND